MAFFTRTGSSTAPSEPLADDDVALYADWREHMVTVVAAGAGIVVVALIALLMGMA